VRVVMPAPKLAAVAAGFGSRAVPPVRGASAGDARAGLAVRWPALSRDPG